MGNEEYITKDANGIENKEIYNYILKLERKFFKKGVHKLFVHKIQQEHVKKIMDLNLYGIKIKDLEFLRCFSHLQNLIIGKIRKKNLKPQKLDISGLRYVIDLKGFFFVDYQIVDFTPLLEHINLESFYYMGGTNKEVIDFSFIQRFKNLKKLDLSIQPICQLYFLEGLENLEELCVSETKLTDFSTLPVLPKLTYLEAESCKLISLDTIRQNALT